MTSKASKPVGRPNKVGRAFDSMAAASGALHIGFRTLQSIKGKGCPAFRWGKVYEKPLREWIEANMSQNENDDYEQTETEELAERAHCELIREGRTLREHAEFMLARIRSENASRNPVPPQTEAA